MDRDQVFTSFGPSQEPDWPSFKAEQSTWNNSFQALDSRHARLIPEREASKGPSSVPSQGRGAQREPVVWERGHCGDQMGRGVPSDGQFGWVPICVHVSGKDQKNHQEEVDDQSQSSQGQKSLCSHYPGWKGLLIQGASDWVLRRALAQ